jgi:hypothetical protein
MKMPIDGVCMPRICFVFILLLPGCASAAYQYAQAKYHGCDVSQLRETRDSVQVLVSCPGSDPFEQTFHKR